MVDLACDPIRTRCCNRRQGPEARGPCDSKKVQENGPDPLGSSQCCSQGSAALSIQDYLFSSLVIHSTRNHLWLLETIQMPWGVREPLDSMDLASVAALTSAEVSLALAALYVAASWSRPMCYAVVPALVLWSALAGIVTNLAVALRYGWWGTLTAKPDHPISCSGEAWLLWLSGGAFFACAFLRVYRNHKVLVRHNSAMWPVPLQLSCMVLPFLLPPAILTAHPSLSAFEEDTQECERRSDPPEAFALGVLVVLVAGTVALTYNLREVRFQAPAEFSAAKTTSVTVLLAILVLPVLHEGLEAERDERRRAILVASSLLTVAVVVIPLWGTLKSFVGARDIETEASGGYVFRKTIQPGTVLKIARDRMKINALASSPGGRDNPEFAAMAWFFRDSLDREVLRDHFLLQASTMRILSKYIWEGAPMFIFLSSACRAELLTTEASSPIIFARARQEIMNRMGGGSVTYCLSPLGPAPSGDSTSSGGPKSSTTPPLSLPQRNKQHRTLPVGAMLARPPQANLAHRSKISSKAAVSGGEMKRFGQGVLGGTSQLSTAFGLRLGISRDSSSEDVPSREKRRGLFVGRSRTGSNASDLERGTGDAVAEVGGEGAGGSGSGGSGDDVEAYPLEADDQQLQEERGAVTAAASGPAESDSLDDLDPFMGLQGTFDFNFAESTDSFPGLSASLRLPVTQKGNHVARKKDTVRSDNVVSISGSSDGGDDDDDDDDNDGEVVIVSPLFVDGLN